MKAKILSLMICYALILLFEVKVYAAPFADVWDKIYMEVLGERWTLAQKHYAATNSAMKNKQWDTAIKELEEFLKTQNGSFYRDDALWKLAQCNKHIGNPKAESEQLNRLIVQHPRSQFRGAAVIRLIKSERGEKTAVQNINACIEFADSSPSDNSAPAALWFAAESLKKSGNIARSNAILERLKTQYPDTLWGERAFLTPKGYTKRHNKNVTLLMTQGHAASQQDKLEEAVEKYQQALGLTTLRNEQVKCLWEIGLIQQRAGNLEQANASFKRISDDYKTSLPADEAMFKQANLVSKMTRFGSIEHDKKKQIEVLEINMLNDQLRCYPTGESAPVAFHDLIIDYYKTGQYDKCIEYLDEMIKKFPDSNWLPHALIMGAHACLKNNDNAGAIRFLEQASGKTNNIREAVIMDDCLVFVKKGRDAFPCFNGKYMDIYLPRWFKSRAQRLAIPKSTDLVWEGLIELTGVNLIPKKRQAVQFNPFSGGGAHSGNPVEAGTFWFPERDDSFSPLGVIAHEIGHNFNGRVKNDDSFLKNNISSLYFHGYCVVEDVYIPAFIIQKGKSVGLPDEFVALVKAEYERSRINNKKTLERYERYLRGGGRQEIFKDQYSVGVGIWFEITEKHGLESCPRFFRYLAEIPETLIKEAKDSKKKNAMIVLAISQACGADMLDSFDKRWRFPIDRDFYHNARKQIEPQKQVGKISDISVESMDEISDEDINPPDSVETIGGEPESDEDETKTEVENILDTEANTILKEE